MAEAIPDARVEIIPDAGHSPQFEAPDTWWKVAIRDAGTRVALGSSVATVLAINAINH